MKIGYICNNCQETTSFSLWIFPCIECGKEICEDCMYGWETCKECAEGKTKEFLKARFEEA